MLYSDMGKLDDAISSFQRALHVEKDNEASTIGLGNVLLKKGDYKEGMRLIKKCEGFILFDNSIPTMEIYS